MSDKSELDFMAIFGGESGSLDLGSTGPDGGNLFSAAEPGVLDFPADAPTPEPDADDSEDDSDAADDVETPDEPESDEAETVTETANPFLAAMAQVEQKVAQDAAKSLFAKPPVFEFGGVSEEITDAKKTFEELRIDKQKDFPELEDGKRVSWTMEYGKISKPVSAPKTAVISKLKAEIEQSKDFLEALKKAKDKNLVCKVKPRITAQTKGIASYKGVFATLEEAERSGKPICILPASDGKVYEIRCNEMGRFVTQANNVTELSAVRPGFSPILPPIPFDLLCEVIAFFRSCMDCERETEALVRIYWDKSQQEFRAVVPEQYVSKARVSADISPENGWDESRYIYYADIHSHNSMPAKFSAIDDLDEKANRVYAVIGRLDRYFPSIAVRICNGGTFLEIDPHTVFANLPDSFPGEWRNQIHAEFPVAFPEFDCEKGAMAA